MALPETVRVKLSSEAAEAISLTPVVVRDLPLRELLEHILGLAGKDEARIREIFRRGSLVSGGTRFRWAGWEPDAAGLQDLLAAFPDADPSREFHAGRCLRAELRGGRRQIGIPREAVARKPLFRSASFWDLLMEVAGGAAPVYHGYSYRERADRFTCQLSTEAIERLRAGSGLVRHTTLRDQIRTVAFFSAEFWVER